MEWYGKGLLFFDIETTGLSIDDNFLCAVGYEWGKDEATFVVHSLDDLYDVIMDNDKVLVTYNGDNWKGGFDLPYLRSKFIRKGYEWVFANMYHLDLLPVIEKTIWTKTEEIVCPSKSSLSADDVKLIAKANDIDYTTKNKTYKLLKRMWNEIGACDWLGKDKKKYKEHNDLQSVYQILYDPNKEEEYIDGADCKDLDIEETVKHCTQDCERLATIAHDVLYTSPEWIIERNINQL